MTSITFDAARVPTERTVPPPLRGWLVAFAVVRGWAATTAAISVVRQLYVTPAYVPESLRAQYSRWTLLAAVWLALELAGLWLLLRRDARAPAYWMLVLVGKLGWLLSQLLPNVARFTNIPSTLLLGVALPLLWLALWSTSPLVRRTFGREAERWRPPAPRAAEAGTMLAGVVLGLLWIAALGASALIGGGGEWKPFVFILYSVLALPLWMITWLWARQHDAAVRGSGWLAVAWIAAALAPFAMVQVTAALPPAIVSALRGLDPGGAVPAVAFTLAMYTIGVVLSGRGAPRAPAPDAG